MQLRRDILWIVVLILLAQLCGCQTAKYPNSTQTSPAILLRTSSGMSQAQLDALVQVPARHEFTVSRDNSVVRCVSYYFRSYAKTFFFVFTNDALGKIALRPDYESAPRG